MIEQKICHKCGVVTANQNRCTSCGVSLVLSDKPTGKTSGSNYLKPPHIILSSIILVCIIISYFLFYYPVKTTLSQYYEVVGTAWDSYVEIGTKLGATELIAESHYEIHVDYPINGSSKFAYLKTNYEPKSKEIKVYINRENENIVSLDVGKDAQWGLIYFMLIAFAGILVIILGPPAVQIYNKHIRQ